MQISGVAILALAQALCLPALAQDVVAVKAGLSEGDGAHVIVAVTLDIQAGWHTYSSVGPNGAGTVTTVTFKVPARVRKVGKLSRPFGSPYFKEPGSTVLTGRVTFSQRFKVPEDASGAIKATVRYQACDDQRCKRPTSIVVSVDLPNAKSSPFAEPVRLLSGGKPLNAEARQMYPSPAWYDVDGDGVTELIVGDISGKLNVYENKNGTGKGDPIWGKPSALKNSEGTEIRVSNW